jgi:hypothetical protein
LTYNSVLLSTIVSTNGKGSQNHIAKTIGANRDSIQKTMVRHIHVHHIGENIWGSLFDWMYIYFHLLVNHMCNMCLLANSQCTFTCSCMNLYLITCN